MSDLAEPTWSLGHAALKGAAAWSSVYLPEALWGDYAALAADACNPAEIYIALAIRFDVDGACDAFEAAYFPLVDRALAGATWDEIADAKALLRERFFATSEGWRVMGGYAWYGAIATLVHEAALAALEQARDDSAQFVQSAAA